MPAVNVAVEKVLILMSKKFFTQTFRILIPAIITLILTNCAFNDHTSNEDVQPQYQTLYQELSVLLKHARATIKQKPTCLSVTLPSYYVFKGNTLLRPYFKQQFQRMAKMVEQQHYKKIVIIGYTDRNENLLDSLELSTSWAQLIKDFWLNNGILQGNIIVKGDGEYAPIASDFTMLGRLQNRRVEIQIYL